MQLFVMPNFMDPVLSTDTAFITLFVYVFTNPFPPQKNLQYHIFQWNKSPQMSLEPILEISYVQQTPFLFELRIRLMVLSLWYCKGWWAHSLISSICGCTCLPTKFEITQCTPFLLLIIFSNMVIKYQRYKFGWLYMAWHDI